MSKSSADVIVEAKVKRWLHITESLETTLHCP